MSRPRLVSNRKLKWTVQMQAKVVDNLTKDLTRQVAKLQAMQEGKTAVEATPDPDQPTFFVSQHVMVNDQEFTVSRLVPGTMLLEEVRSAVVGSENE